LIIKEYGGGVLMAFGRDGSELELYIADMQNRTLKEALNSIIDISKDKKVISIASDALKRTQQIQKSFDE
jgi:hypothetical protein